MITNAQFQEMERRVASKVEARTDFSSTRVSREKDLHEAILDACRQRQWIAFHGSMAHRAMRTPGEPDFVILAEDRRIFLIECKARDGKLTTEQLGIKMWAERLGHVIHVVRSVEQFLEIVK